MYSVESAGIALGLASALGVFAFKTAVGEYYFLTVTRSRVRRIIFPVVTGGLYLLLFAAAFTVLERFDLLRFAENSMGFLRAGVAIHLILCAGLLLWGIRLLCLRDDETPGKAGAGGWLLLAIPCPVCAAAIFLVCAFARLLFPEEARALWVAAPLFFLAANLVFLGGLWTLSRILPLHPLHLTGKLMIGIALYFFLVLLIAPQFQDVEKLYAAARSTGDWPGPAWPVAAVCILLAGSAGIGFLLETFKRKGR